MVRMKGVLRTSSGSISGALRTTEDGLLMIGGHTVGAGGRFAGMPVGTFAAIALGRAPVEAAVWARSPGALDAHDRLPGKSRRVVEGREAAK